MEGRKEEAPSSLSSFLSCHAEEGNHANMRGESKNEGKEKNLRLCKKGNLPSSLSLLLQCF